MYTDRGVKDCEHEWHQVGRTKDKRQRCEHCPAARHKSSTWLTIWFYTDPKTGKRTQAQATFASQAEARAHLEKILPDVNRGGWRPDENLSVNELLDRWLAAKRQKLRPGTAAMYENVLEGWVKPHLGGLPANELNETHAADLVATLEREGSRLGRGGLSPRSRQLAIDKLKAACTWGHKTGLLPRDPLLGFDRTSAPDSTASDSWTIPEARRFLEATRGDRMAAAWALLLGRGLRRGELAGLRWPNIDLDAGRLAIVETRVVVKAKPTTSQPKTDAGRRPIPLDAGLVAVLRAHRKRQREEHMAARSSWADTDYVFVDEVGNPYRPETIARRFEQLTKKAGLRRIRLQDTRHTAATLMISKPPAGLGIDPKTVAAILGHSSDAITRRIYQHILDGMTDTAGEALSGLLGIQ